MNIINTIKTNLRDILAGVGITLAVAFLADIIERIAVTKDGALWLANVVQSLRGLAAFAGANLAAFFMVAIAWPTLNRYSNDSFAESWKALDPHEKFQAFLTVAIGYLIAAAICFAG